LNNQSISLLNAMTKNAGLELSGKQLKAFSMFGDLLIEKNRQVNLTSITGEADIAAKHFYDSLTPVIYAKMPPIQANGSSREPVKIVDVGSGAGFPGIPLKILFGKALDVTFIEATGKKINFINEVISALGLCGCHTVHARAEEAVKHPDMHGKFDYAIARALAALPKLCVYCLPFLKTGGKLIAMKGRRDTAEREIAQSDALLAGLGGRIVSVDSFLLQPHINGQGDTGAPDLHPDGQDGRTPDLHPDGQGKIPAPPVIGQGGDSPVQHSVGDMERTLIVIEKVAMDPIRSSLRA